MAFSYNEYGMLDNSRFKTVKELSDWQKDKIRKDAENGKEYFTDNVSVSTVKIT